MNRKDMVLRSEAVADYRMVEELTREAFWNQHNPNAIDNFRMQHHIRFTHVRPECRDVTEMTISEQDFTALGGKAICQ